MFDKQICLYLPFYGVGRRVQFYSEENKTDENSFVFVFQTSLHVHPLAVHESRLLLHVGD